MESFLTEYHIDFPPFQALLRETSSLVAGSSALALYLKSNGVNPGYEPGDMDVWIEEYTTQGHRVETLFLNFLFTQGYSLQKVFTNNESDNGQYDFQNHNIRSVVSLVDDYERKIQIITIGERILTDYIAKAFDLSCCVTWWNATTNVFETLSPELTLQKKMYISNKTLQNQYAVDARTIKLDERIKKYSSRGFQLEEMPCRTFERADCRSALSDESFVGLSAFDLFAYEDVSFCEFLQASSWHIVVKAGDTFQAFHRKKLYTYMVGRETHVPFLEYIYDTPNNQSILQCALEMLLYADYSIYELCSEYPVYVSPNRQKSMFTLKCYTVKQWLDRTEGLTLSPPPFASFPAPPIPASESEIPPYVPADNVGHFSMAAPPDIPDYNIHLEAIDDVLSIINDLEFYFHIQPHN
jgi:hypothetical protein